MFLCGKNQLLLSDRLKIDTTKFGRNSFTDDDGSHNFRVMKITFCL